jgi:hypothetical protein
MGVPSNRQEQVIDFVRDAFRQNVAVCIVKAEKHRSPHVRQAFAAMILGNSIIAK